MVEICSSNNLKYIGAIRMSIDMLIIDIADKVTKTDNFETLPGRINLKNPKIHFGKKLEVESIHT